MRRPQCYGRICSECMVFIYKVLIYMVYMYEFMVYDAIGYAQHAFPNQYLHLSQICEG